MRTQSQGHPGMSRRIVGVVLGLVLLGAACGEGGGTAAAPTTTTGATAVPAPTSTVARGAPRWETVVTLSGTGPAQTPPFAILAESIQWRARWRCDAGRLGITTDPAPRRPAPLVDATCPGKGEDFSIVSGNVRLAIEAAGPWEVIVDQQVDTPLREPPLEGAEAAPVLAQGSFYDVEKQAKGTARLSRRTDGSIVLRLEGFEVSTNVDLFVWLSEAAAPKTSVDATSAPHVVLGNLKSTNGDQNYVLPATVDPERVRSIVIWCEPIRIAYGAAALS